MHSQASRRTEWRGSMPSHASNAKECPSIRLCGRSRPPLVGRARLRRRWVGAGTYRAIRLAPVPSSGTKGRNRGSKRSRRTQTLRRPRSRARRPVNNVASVNTNGTPCSGQPDHAPNVARPTHRQAGDPPRPAADNQLGTLRVGEASNPGPTTLLNWISSVAASAVSYAAPGRPGFYDIYSPGFEGHDPGPPEEPFTLRVMTANTTGWRPLQRLLCSTSANVVFAQEHRLRPDDVPAASAWARKTGGRRYGPRPRKGAAVGRRLEQWYVHGRLWACDTLSVVGPLSAMPTR